MKICFLAGANSVHSQRWIKYFAERGHEVHWLSLGVDADGDNAIKNTKFYLIKKFPLRLLRPLFYIISLKKILKKIKLDIFQAHQVWIDGIVGALSGFHPLVITAWGSDVLISPKKSRISKILTKFALKKADLVTCDGENTKEAMINLGTDPKKIKIIYFGIDIEKFKPFPKDENLKEKLNIFSSPVIISLRSLTPGYDLETLIRAIPIVLKEMPDAKFIIAGKGEEENYLKDLAESLRILENIEFVGKIPHHDLPKYLILADIYVSTSLSDGGLAVSTAEAMACGLPVVITDSGDNKKWVKNGENGFITPLKNPKVLSEKIIYLLKNENLRKKMGKLNREIIKEKYNYYKEMDKVENIYKNLIKTKL